MGHAASCSISTIMQPPVLVRTVDAAAGGDLRVLVPPHLAAAVHRQQLLRAVVGTAVEQLRAVVSFVTLVKSEIGCRVSYSYEYRTHGGRRTVAHRPSRQGAPPALTPLASPLPSPCPHLPACPHSTAPPLACKRRRRLRTATLDRVFRRYTNWQTSCYAAVGEFGRCIRRQPLRANRCCGVCNLRGSRERPTLVQ